MLQKHTVLCIASLLRLESDELDMLFASVLAITELVSLVLLRRFDRV